MDNNLHLELRVLEKINELHNKGQKVWLDEPFLDGKRVDHFSPVFKYLGQNGYIKGPPVDIDSLATKMNEAKTEYPHVEVDYQLTDAGFNHMLSLINVKNS